MAKGKFGFEEKPDNLGLSSYNLYWYSYDKKYSYNDNMCYQKRKLLVYSLSKFYFDMEIRLKVSKLSEKPR